MLKTFVLNLARSPHINYEKM